MKKARTVFVIGTLILVSILLVSVDGMRELIATQRAELEALQERYAVITYALKEFQIVRSPGSTGDVANLAGANIIRALHRADLNFGAIGASEAEVARFVAEAYARSAHKALAELKELRANPRRAEVLTAEFFYYVECSEKNLAAFVANANVISELIARNYIGAAKAQGARVSVSSLRQQGVTVGKAPTRKSVAKKATAKPAKHSTPARRR
jgi:hypothetical protein